MLRKTDAAKKLRIGIQSIKFPNLKLNSILQSIRPTVTLAIDNFSSTALAIEQLKIDVYSKSGKLIATQQKPMDKSFFIQPKQENLLPLVFEISSGNVLMLALESGGIKQIATNKVTTNSYGIPLRITGFVTTQKISIPINQEITV